MIEASNLGQVVGRAMYGGLEPRRLDTIPLVAAPLSASLVCRTVTPMADADAKAQAKSRAQITAERKEALRRLIGREGPVSSAQVACELGVDRSYACATMKGWIANGFLARHGKPGAYRYVLGPKSRG